MKTLFQSSAEFFALSLGLEREPGNGRLAPGTGLTMQPALALAYCLRESDPALLDSLFREEVFLPEWYTQCFLEIQLKQLGFRAVYQLPLAGEFPDRYSAGGKKLLQIRLRGLRYSVSELLLFLAFLSLGKLFPEFRSDPPGGALTGVENALPQVLELLDYHLFELFSHFGGTPCLLEDLLHRGYRADFLRCLEDQLDGKRAER